MGNRVQTIRRGVVAMGALTLALGWESAGASTAVELPHVRVSLHEGWVEPDGTRIAGLEFALAPGWKTYWRAPGAGGLPPHFDWAGSENIRAIEVEWPVPVIFDSFGIETIGYSDVVVLPLVLTPEDPTAPLSLSLALDFGVCADICIPAHAALSSDMAPTAAQGAARVRAHRAHVPPPAAAHGVSRAACGVVGAGETRRFEASLDFVERPDADPTVVVEGPADVWIGPAALRWDGRTLVAEAPVDVFGEGVWVARDALRLTLLWPGHGLDVQGCAPL